MQSTVRTEAKVLASKIVLEVAQRRGKNEAANYRVWGERKHSII